MVPFVSEILNKNFTPKMGHFFFFNLSRITLKLLFKLIKKYISQEASFAVQQSLRRVKSPKTRIREKNYILIINECDFYYIKNRISVYKKMFKKFAQIFGDLTPLKLC